MSKHLDSLLKDSGPQMPESGEYRRLNRAVMRDKIDSDAVRRGRGFRTLVIAASLVMMTLLAGKLSPLGSDDWEVDSVIGTNALGEEITLHRDPNSSLIFNSEGSPNVLRDLQQSWAAQDGVLARLACVSYGGAENWWVYRLQEIDGEVRELNMPNNPPGLPKQEPPDYIHFLKTYYRDILVRSRLTPPDETNLRMLEGIVFQVDSWTHWYARHGWVTYSSGEPIDSDQLD